MMMFIYEIGLNYKLRFSWMTAIIMALRIKASTRRWLYYARSP